MDKPVDIVFVGAHPDDLEIACGGTIASLVDQGYRVAMIDLTDGEPTPLCESPEIRRKEAASAAAVLGVLERKILDLPNRRLMDGFEARVALAKEFRRLRPRIVVGFGHKTPLASPDHEQAMHITDAAVFYSRLSKWDQYFDGMPVHSIQSQLYFRLGFEPLPQSGFDNQFTVDISATLAKKIESIRCYQTQFPAAKEYVFERVKAIAMAAGASVGLHAAEVFSNTKPNATRDLVRFVSEVKES